MSRCWPGKCPCQLGTRSFMLFARGVSIAISRTSASCHSSRRTGATAVSITVISLLFPGVAIVVIAQRLPEAALILFHESQSAHPFSTFPKVKMRHEQPRWTTMRWQNRQALVSSRDHALAANQIGDRDICHVTTVAVSHDVRRGMPSGGLLPSANHQTSRLAMSYRASTI